MSQTDKPDEQSSDGPADETTEYGLTQRGAFDVVQEVVDLEGDRDGRQNSKFALRDMYHHLIRVGEGTKAALLDRHYRPVELDVDPERGRYGELSDRQWWFDIGAPTLAALPGLEPPADEQADDGRWKFTGLSTPDVFGEEAVLLSELRDDPELRAARAFGGMGKSGSKRELLVELLATIERNSSRVNNPGSSSTALASKIPDDTAGSRAVEKRRYFDEKMRDRLLDIPGVEVERWEPRAPDEIPIDTYADVLEAQEEIDSDPEETWTWTRTQGADR